MPRHKPEAYKLVFAKITAPRICLHCNAQVICWRSRLACERGAIIQVLEELKGDRGLVFTTRNGTPISPRNLQRHFNHSLENAGLPKMRFHDLKYTASSLLFNSKRSPKNCAGDAGTFQHLLDLRHLQPYNSSHAERCSREDGRAI